MKEQYEKELKDLGYSVVYFRRKREMTQQQLADIMDVNYETISRIENAKAGLSLGMLIRLSKGLDISLSELFAHANL